MPIGEIRVDVGVKGIGLLLHLGNEHVHGQILFDECKLHARELPDWVLWLIVELQHALLGRHEEPLQKRGGLQHVRHGQNDEPLQKR